ncbi:MAG: hypothetical protein EBR82_66980 [Caulobacteraceae bacterium]|nr:hypothetical protein [Caulobacteraceae bacterium]
MIKITRIIERQPPPDEHDDCPDYQVDDEMTEQVSFRELVQEMRRFSLVSCSPAIGATYEWLLTEPAPDYMTGDEITETLHFDHDNPPRAAKYWRKAMHAAGLIKIRG